MGKLISVIMYLRNEEATFLQNFGNLIYQSIYEKYGEGAMELILIDDFSTDGTPALIDNMCAQFPERVRGYHLQERLGPGGASNFGIDEAKGTYIAFMNPADMADVTFYESLYAEVEANGFAYDYVDSPAYSEMAGKTLLATPKELQGMLSPESRCLLLTNTGLIYTKIFRADFLREKNIRLREHSVLDDADEDFMAEVVCLAGSVAVCETPLFVKKKKEKSQLPQSRMSSFTQHFSALVSSCVAVYGRLSSLEGYEEVRLGAEAFYMRRIATALRLYEKELDSGLILPPMDEQLLHTLRMAADTVIRTPLAENPYAIDAIAPAAAKRLNRYIGV